MDSASPSRIRGADAKNSGLASLKTLAQAQSMRLDLPQRAIYACLQQLRFELTEDDRDGLRHFLQMIARTSSWKDLTWIG